ncbi:MAG: MBL fold metallo-hydrolase [Candidatus Eiseniibacteriota bacterium]
MSRPRPLAAAIVLYRRVPALEIYWVRRSDGLAFLGGFHAFPGGRLVEEDREAGADPLVACAVRETFEETGVLLARGARRVPRERRDEARKEMLEDRLRLPAFLAAESLVLEAQDFTPAGRWIAPPFSPGGFDTQFFLAELPDSESPDVWPGELAEGEWITPAEGLARWRANRAMLAAPALYLLRELSARPDASAKEWGEALARPEEARGGYVPRIEVHPGFVLVPVRTPTLAPATHTNCLLIGGSEILIVDPGSPYPDEQDALDAAIDRLTEGEGRSVRGIFVTHHHADHWGGVDRLRARLGVPVLAHAYTAPFCRADEILEGGETIALAPAPVDRPWNLEVLFTPGHTPGHLALFDRISGTIVAGDLVSGLSTIVIDPPEGDMAQYVASLARLLDLPATLILPGHGPPIGAPGHRLRALIAHREWREGRVLEALAAGPSTIEDMLPSVYADTPADRHGLAARSALAHLLKLQKENRVREGAEGRWQLS